MTPASTANNSATAANARGPAAAVEPAGVATAPASAPAQRHAGGAILAVGFGTTVGMWAVGYVARLPAVSAPAWLVACCMFAVMCAGGWVAGRFAAGGWRTAALSGLLSALLNVLILGSLLTATGAPGSGQRSVLWLPLWLVFGTLVGALAGTAGARGAATLWTPQRWTFVQACVTAAATFLLLIVGGLVTSAAAGLAVPDWPRTFGANMFLYPLSRMTGGIYYEHAHRLFGALVGLTTLTLMARLIARDPRRWVRIVGVVAFVQVVVQGVLGGLRVTEVNLTLAVLHGIDGQLFFALLVALAAFTSPRWAQPETPRAAAGSLAATPVTAGAGATAQAALTAVLVALVVFQLTLGAILRHTGVGLIAHITFAAFVTALGLVCGLQAWSRAGSDPLIRRLGVAVALAVVLQVTLGVVALAATAFRQPGAPATPADLVARTIHQANGALVLGATLLLALWVRRLGREAAPNTSEIVRAD